CQSLRRAVHRQAAHERVPRRRPPGRHPARTPADRGRRPRDREDPGRGTARLGDLGRAAMERPDSGAQIAGAGRKTRRQPAPALPAGAHALLPPSDRAAPRGMKVVERYGIAAAPECEGTVVVIDVLRAFTTAAYAFAAG